MAATYDAIVIGGGVTGAGVARDLALRGRSVLLLEKGDWGGGTSGSSSWMIHGGPRYLTFDWETTRLSCVDAGHIVRIARHLVHRCVFLLPVLPRDRNGLEQMDTAMEVYDRFQPLKHSHPHRRLAPEEARRLEPGLTDGLLGALTMEEWGVDPHRLVWANVLDARNHGAVAANHSPVVSLLRDGARVVGVRYRQGGAVCDALGAAVVNATGPWAPRVGTMAGVRIDLRPAKGIHIVYDRRVSNYAISSEAIDGRELILVPHGPISILGTTDDDYYGDLDAVPVLEDEVAYLVQGMARSFPAIGRYRPVRATVGVRPTLFEWRRYEDDLSRRHEVVDHGPAGAPGLISVLGGKLSMYRLMAEEAADLVCSRLDQASPPSRTATTPLPGAAGEAPPAAELARAYGVPELVAARLRERHGDGVVALLEERRGEARRVVCRCEFLSEAELAHACATEQVTSLADAFRRVGLAAGPCAGTACLERAAEICGEVLGWSSVERSDAVWERLEVAWRGRAPLLDRWGWAQEELAYGARRGWRR
ncbi:MAG TPA: FAD-dependent oxidoreductase [Candidatus Dormibacteraeota bacterium]|jgi:glycerol-3-phosphate dehydrogenase|nr:FAD-dependent oxidoreductase [Candidatus Dormibacteraeota bacterium]